LTNLTSPTKILGMCPRHPGGVDATVQCGVPRGRENMFASMESGAMPPDKFSKINVEIAYFLHFCKMIALMCSVGKAFDRHCCLYVPIDRHGEW